jgi:hypothetical protein
MKTQYVYIIEEAELLSEEEIDEIALILTEMTYHHFYGKENVGNEKIPNSL